jgi:hypothetical protein
MFKQRVLTDFAFGLLSGLVIGFIISGFIYGLVYLHNRNKEGLNYVLEYVEKQNEMEALREDYSSRTADDFLEIPDVRRAADGASDEFIRKRDEILQRFRDRIAD